MTDRLKALVHHLICTYQPHELGITKLAKILWFSDVEHFRSSGESLTGVDDYRKEKRGPLLWKLYDVLGELKAEGKIIERSNLTPVGDRREYVWISHPNLDGLTAEDVALVDRIAAFITPMSAREASESTHDELWDAVGFGQRIPVAAAAVIFEEVTDDAIEWAKTTFNDEPVEGSEVHRI